jgi:hypothetical protein
MPLQHWWTIRPSVKVQFDIKAGWVSVQCQIEKEDTGHYPHDFMLGGQEAKGALKNSAPQEADGIPTQKRATSLNPL